MAIQLSQHFTLEEAIVSETAARKGIDNSHPSQEVITSASSTAVHMELVRGILGHPIHVNSWIRCHELNAALGSKSTSQHVLGEAVDFICPQFGSPIEICKKLISTLGVWDQMILEFDWVHIAFKSSPDVTNRGEVLSLLLGGDYAQGLTSPTGHKLA
jgi:putative chitinase